MTASGSSVYVGVAGYASTNSGSGTTYGVYGVGGGGTDNSGVYGFNNNTNTEGILAGDDFGVRGESNLTSGNGVEGESFNGYGVYGTSTNGLGVFGLSANSTAVYGLNTGATGWAGYFNGDTHVTGDLSVAGTLSKGSGTFKIDHPLDPENKYLYHSFVESPDMMNVYNGNVILDTNGEATVTMPEWFDTLNRDFRYQLTAIGKPGPNLYIAQEITENHFMIAGGQSGMKVSWMVTGIRKDPFAETHRSPVEEDKPEAERGYYLYPEAYGQPPEKGIEWTRSAELLQKIKEHRNKRIDISFNKIN